MIKDMAGNEITYWPITGLIEGENSDTLLFTVDMPPTPSSGPAPVAGLYANADARAQVWVKKVGDIDFVNVSGSRYSFDDLIGSGTVDFEGYVKALTPIVGLQRVPMSVVSGQSSQAGWLYPIDPEILLGPAPPAPPES